ncbi:anti-sigma factor antagonist [Amycolatopsis balhimycina DSM 5908]|uniref:Anti-sigma factor antagonist n=1 Tax=Amycolatopsis balhimycina DSM 5908 TaxID=1081091 RepID=A0A428WNL5_AMYBA|nr:STAS domain-containing protein [Amycolatopsis balhimycina]RSM44643.1 anti-sigma factor antagonist [Amycolatopsis balhimycina DSM 5908]
MTTHERVRVATVDPPSARRLPAPRASSDGDLRSQTRWKSADAIVVEVGGEIDACTAPLLEAALAEHVRACPGVLRVDLGQVGFLGAAGLRTLVRAHRDAEAAGVHLVIDPGRSRAAVRALELLDALDVPLR